MFPKKVFAFLLAAAISPAGPIVWTPAGVNNLYSNPNNWSTGVVPNGAVDVLIGNPVAQPSLTTSVSLNNLTLSAANSSLTTSSGVTLTINGGAGSGTISNAGQLVIQSSAGASTLLLSGPGSTFTNSGTGQIVLTSETLSSISSSDPNITLQNNSTIQGAGGISGGNAFKINNTGTINASVNGAGFNVITMSGISNTGTLQATGGGQLLLNTNVIDNTGGLIQADGAGSLVQLAGVHLQNGTLQTLNGGTITTLGPLTVAGTIAISGELAVSTNTGLGHIASLQLSNAAGSTVTLNGGVVNLVGGSTISTTQAGMTLQNNATIQGSGGISSGVSLILNNAGTINANVNGQILVVNPNFSGSGNVNTGTMQAANGGTLLLQGQFQNNGGLIQADGVGSLVQLTGAQIANGTLQTLNGGSIVASGLNNALSGTVALNGTMNVQHPASAAELRLLTGTVLNVNTNQGGQLNVIAGVADSSLILRSNIAPGTVTLNGGVISLSNGTTGVAHVSANQAGMMLLNNATIRGNGVFDATAGSTFAITNNGTIDAQGGALVINSPSITNNGILRAESGATLAIPTAALTNFDGATHTLTGGTYDAENGQIAGSSAFSVSTNQAHLILSGPNGAITDMSGNNALRFLSSNGANGILEVDGGNQFALTGGLANAGSLLVDSLSSFATSGVYTQTGGSTRVDGAFQAASLALQGGTLSGAGTITGSVNNTGGTIAPGDSPGTLTINGNYTQGDAGMLAIEIAGLMSYDRLAITGNGHLGGTLEVMLLGYTGNAGDVFRILTSNGLLGTNFANFILPSLGNGLSFQESISGNDVLLSVVGPTGPATPEPSTFLLLAGGLALGALVKRKGLKRC